MLKFTTIDITKPIPCRVVYGAAYWTCIDGDVTKALFYNDSSQCNQNERIMTYNLIRPEGSLYSPLNVKIIFIEISFVPQRKI